MNRMPKAGDVVLLTRAASVQFTSPLLFRVIDYTTYGSTPDGWIWLVGYELNSSGEAVERRELFVQTAGLKKVNPQPVATTRNELRKQRKAAAR